MIRGLETVIIRMKRRIHFQRVRKTPTLLQKLMEMSTLRSFRISSTVMAVRGRLIQE
jgi:hypothetical protein